MTPLFYIMQCFKIFNLSMQHCPSIPFGRQQALSFLCLEESHPSSLVNEISSSACLCLLMGLHHHHTRSVTMLKPLFDLFIIL